MNGSHRCARWLLAAVWIAISWASNAQETSMTLDQALARARQRAPRVLAAQDQVREARGRLTGASVLLQENPVVETMAGTRYSAGGNTTDYDVSIAQPIELGGRRAARIAGAQADVDRETVTRRNAVRRLLARAHRKSLCERGPAGHCERSRRLLCNDFRPACPHHGPQGLRHPGRQSCGFNRVECAIAGRSHLDDCATADRLQTRPPRVHARDAGPASGRGSLKPALPSGLQARFRRHCAQGSCSAAI